MTDRRFPPDPGYPVVRNAAQYARLSLFRLGWLALAGLMAVTVGATAGWAYAGTLMIGGAALIAYSVGGLLWVYRPRPEPQRPPRCVGCGYDLIGLPADASCPECGRAGERRSGRGT